jgi:phosphate transport system permease protein
MSPLSPPDDLLLAPRRRWSVTQALSYAFTALALGSLLLMLALFVAQSLPVWRHSGAGYLTGQKWFYRRQVFGALSMLYGTVVVSGIALLVAAPLGVGAAVFTAEFLPPRLRLAAKVTVELLAGIPSVVYGLLGILFLRTYVYDALTWAGFDPLSGDTLLTAGLLLAVMVLPTVMTLADDAFRAVPAAQRQAARGLGLSRVQAVLAVSLPQAKAGVTAAVLLGLGRALGEAIAVFLVVGRRDNVLPAPFYSPDPIVNAGQTLTSKLGGAEVHIAYGDPLHWAAVVGLGLLLLTVATAVTLAGAALGRKGDVHAA